MTMNILLFLILVCINSPSFARSPYQPYQGYQQYDFNQHQNNDYYQRELIKNQRTQIMLQMMEMERQDILRRNPCYMQGFNCQKSFRSYGQFPR